MRIGWIGSVLLAVLLGGSPPHAQSPQEVPRMADGKPDFTGIYTPPATVNGSGPRGDLIFNADNMAPLKPGAESLFYVPRTGDTRIDEPRAMCLPAGFPSGMLYILPIQFIHHPNYLVIIPELQRAARIIPTDGVRTAKESSRRTMEIPWGGGKETRWSSTPSTSNAGFSTITTTRIRQRAAGTATR